MIIKSYSEFTNEDDKRLLIFIPSFVSSAQVIKDNKK